MRLLTAVSLVRVQQGELSETSVPIKFNNWLHGQAVKTPPFHGGNRGSNPLGVILRAGKWNFRAARNRKNTYADVAQFSRNKDCVHDGNIRRTNACINVRLMFSSYRRLHRERENEVFERHAIGKIHTPMWLNWQSSWFVISRLTVRVRSSAFMWGPVAQLVRATGS